MIENQGDKTEEITYRRAPLSFNHKGVITHREVQHMVREFMTVKKWELVAKRTKGIDDLFRNGQNETIMCEYKPEGIGERELITGVGEITIANIKHGMRCYLVIHEVDYQKYKDLVLPIPWIGLFLYSPDKRITHSRTAKNLRLMLKINNLISIDVIRDLLQPNALVEVK